MTLPGSEEPIRPRKLHEQVAERLRALILDRKLRPGDRLPSERELMRLYGIGRPAVREALLLLERSGLLTLRSGSPATVADADPQKILREVGFAVKHFLAEPEGIREIQAARRLLECGLVRQAARQCSAEDIAILRDILDRSQIALDDKTAFETLDLEFHALIVRLSGSRVFEAVFDAMQEWLRNQRTVALALPGQTGIALAHHRNILDALETRSPDRAEDAMHTHLVNVEQTYWTAMTAAERSAKAVEADGGRI